MRAFNFIGAGDRSRTCDLRITNALLYLLSYTGARLRIIRGSAVGLKSARIALDTPIRVIRSMWPRRGLAMVAFEVVLDLAGQLLAFGAGHCIALAGLVLDLAGQLVALLAHQFVFTTGRWNRGRQQRAEGDAHGAQCQRLLVEQLSEPAARTVCGMPQAFRGVPAGVTGCGEQRNRKCT